MKHTQTLSELQEEIIKSKVDDLARHIDEGLMLDTLVEGGWTKIPFYFYSNEQAIDIKNWCEQTFKKNQWNRLAGSFVFRKKKDAEWFVLRWL